MSKAPDKIFNLAEVLERISDAFIALDKNWCYTYVNKKAADIVGLSPQEMIGKNIWELFPASVGSPFHKAYLEAMDNQNYVFLEEHYPPLNKWFENYIYPSTEGLSVFIRETTEQKIAEETKNYLATLIENMHDAIFSTDAAFIIQTWNKGAEEIYGFTAEEAIGKMVNRLLSTDYLGTPLEKLIDEFNKTGNFKNEVIQKTKTGESINIYVSSSALYDAEGNLRGALAINQNITERKKAELELKAEKNRFEKIVNTVPGVICTYKISADGTMSFPYSSPGTFEMFGLRPEEIAGDASLLFQRVHPDDIESIQKAITESAKNMTEYLHEYRFNHSQKGLIWIEARSLPAPQSDGSIIWTGFISDTTERKKAEQKILQMNEQLRNLSSHLQNIREEEQTRIAREIHDELGQQLTSLTIELSNLNKLAGTSIPKVAEKISSMKELVNTTITTVRKIATQLRPGILDDLGLVAALEWQFTEFEHNSGIKCVFDAWVKKNEFPKDLSTAVFRIAQESLTNIARHSGATEAKGILYEKENNLILEIYDNGKGISGSSAGKKTFGIVGMRERAAMLNGEFSLSNNAESGICVTLKLPLP